MKTSPDSQTTRYPVDPQDRTEALISINGHALSYAQSMTVRVAIESFAQSLVNDGLGEDEHGKKMTGAYLDRIREIRGPLYEIR